MCPINPICKRHPQNTIDDFLYNWDKGRKRYKCRECRHEIASKHYQHNKDKINEKNNSYRRVNPSRYLEYRKNDRIKKQEAVKELHEKLKITKKNIFLSRRLVSIVLMIEEVKRRYEKLKRYSP